jgi:hypothetical protein
MFTCIPIAVNFLEAFGPCTVSGIVACPLRQLNVQNNIIDGIEFS